MADIDTMVLTADPDHTTVWAAALNYAMERDASARYHYARIYGAEWSPLGNGVAIEARRETESSTAQTRT